jgi:hypothetical protein
VQKLTVSSDVLYLVFSEDKETHMQTSTMSTNTVHDIGLTSPTATPEDFDTGVDRDAKLILFSHEFPSGDVQDLLRRLHRHAKLPRHPHLACFLQGCASVLRNEVQKLPRPLRELVPPFHDVATLVSHWDELKNGPLQGTWEGAFLCIYEIAMLIG